ncbi:ABC-type Fe3+-hydroxamate transport system, substrate-binding protein [Algoriphagus locisalis]|uniref:ABC-type Fe3+-hydroxamate transport system, substrate-binding protein n=1 Tax=Algoriphagus locisalis TaxID=305507 RepID=A0A1I7D1J5_9BACT|nr:helical backbone metal receptor [Algoriphagus locisalis]SFU05532.1 ABC-type Fe3+-hydroxamate transport system, substrate-binding protein [Algoriphagus locisalis]
MQFTDQLKRSVSLPSPPQRIISLVPSQTELLVDLGLEERLVGVTKFCVHPEGLRKLKTIVGGTKNYRMDVIDSLKPDLIIGNKEENEQEGIEALMGKYPLWMSDIYNLEDSLEMVASLGEMLGAKAKSEQLIKQLSKDFANPLAKKGKAVYLIWKDPIMVAGAETFINEMLGFAGYENLIRTSRYPQLSENELVELNPEHLLLSSEPFPFKENHIEYYHSLLPKAKIRLVDGEIFSWYGSRLLKAKAYCESL